MFACSLLHKSAKKAYRHRAKPYAPPQWCTESQAMHCRSSGHRAKPASMHSQATSCVQAPETVGSPWLANVKRNLRTVSHTRTHTRQPH